MALPPPRRLPQNRRFAVEPYELKVSNVLRTVTDIPPLTYPQQCAAKLHPKEPNNVGKDGDKRRSTPIVAIRAGVQLGQRGSKKWPFA